VLGCFHVHIFVFFRDSVLIQALKKYKQNDVTRRYVFELALRNKAFKVPPSTSMLHKVVSTHQDACLVLSEGVDELNSEQKRLLFEACIDIHTSEASKPNTFNPACDPNKEHTFATILVPGVPVTWLKLDFMESESDEHFPVDMLESCVRVYTLMFPSEY
jgi:hypothetical protein